MNIYKSPRWFLPSEWRRFGVRAAEVRYDPLQPRNAKGMWCKEGISGTSSKGLDKSEKSGIIKSSEDFSYISASGPNEFKKGFSHSNLVNHWYGNDNPKISSHKAEYEARGYDMKGYSELALDLVQKPVGNGVVGHKTNDGFVVRYNTKTGDFVKGNPKHGIKTMFTATEDYYLRRKAKDTEAKNER